MKGVKKKMLETIWKKLAQNSIKERKKNQKKV